MATFSNIVTSSTTTTTSATPINTNGVDIPEDAHITVEAVVSAKSTTDVAASWRLAGTVRRNGSDPATFVESIENIIPPQKDEAALLWNATLVIVDDVVLQVRVTGAIEKTISWGTGINFWTLIP